LSDLKFRQLIAVSGEEPLMNYDVVFNIRQKQRVHPWPNPNDRNGAIQHARIYLSLYHADSVEVRDEKGLVVFSLQAEKSG
jgi:hypothetical protein